MNINFAAEFLFGVGWILVSAMGYFDLTVDLSAQLIVFGGGIFAAGGEIFLFMGIERGELCAFSTFTPTKPHILQRHRLDLYAFWELKTRALLCVFVEGGAFVRSCGAHDGNSSRDEL